MRARVYLIVGAVMMMSVGIIVVALNRDLSTDLLGGVAILGGIAVIVNAVLDLTGNGKD
jgi:hypothetical protein